MNRIRNLFLWLVDGGIHIQQPRVMITERPVESEELQPRVEDRSEEIRRAWEAGRQQGLEEGRQEVFGAVANQYIVARDVVTASIQILIAGNRYADITQLLILYDKLNDGYSQLVAKGYKPVDDFRSGLETCYYYRVWKQTMDGSNTSGIYSRREECRGSVEDIDESTKTTCTRKRSPYERYEVWLKAGLLLGLPAERLLAV